MTHTTTLHRVNVAVIGIRFHVVCVECGVLTAKPVPRDEARDIVAAHGSGK